jgi:hypothetical protein
MRTEDFRILPDLYTSLKKEVRYCEIRIANIQKKCIKEKRYTLSIHGTNPTLDRYFYRLPPYLCHCHGIQAVQTAAGYGLSRYALGWFG